MSLKNDIAMVKEELNSEEKFFEKAVMTEKFVKKYKTLLISSVVIVVLVVVANVAYSINQNSQTLAVNNAFEVLTTDAKDKEALATLKTISPELYDVWLYSQALASNDFSALKTLKNSKAIALDDMVSYEIAQDAKTVASLDSYAMGQNAIYKDLAIIQSAIILMGNKEISKAHEKLSQIPAQSSLAKIADALLHYGVK